MATRSVRGQAWATRRVRRTRRGSESSDWNFESENCKRCKILFNCNDLKLTFAKNLLYLGLNLLIIIKLTMIHYFKAPRLSFLRVVTLSLRSRNYFSSLVTDPPGVWWCYQNISAGHITPDTWHVTHGAGRKGRLDTWHWAGSEALESE